MGKNVYANGNAIAAKVGGGKVIAAFPDVCMSPPPPPAGPIPIPYPNSSFSKDLKKGSKTVKIGGKPMALEDSFYKTSPLGNEAATKNFGAAVLSHQTSGKTQFAAYSFDVKVEGKNVCRHFDLTTSNHGSYPGNTPPGSNLEAMMIAKAVQAIKDNLCPCCQKAEHYKSKQKGSKSTGKLPDQSRNQNRDEYYEGRIDQWGKNKSPIEVSAMKAKYKALIKKAMVRPGCKCAKPPPNLLPEPPCDVFYDQPESKAEAAALTKAVAGAWSSGYKKRYQRESGIPKSSAECESIIKKKLAEAGEAREPTQNEIDKQRQTNHLTPKSAGGCPGNAASQGNLVAHYKLCFSCQQTDGKFELFQEM